MSVSSTSVALFDGSSTTVNIRAREFATNSFSDFWNPLRTFSLTFVAPAIGVTFSRSHSPIPSVFRFQAVRGSSSPT